MMNHDNRGRSRDAMTDKYRNYQISILGGNMIINIGGEVKGKVTMSEKDVTEITFNRMSDEVTQAVATLMQEIINSESAVKVIKSLDEETVVALTGVLAGTKILYDFLLVRAIQK